VTRTSPDLHAAFAAVFGTGRPPRHFRAPGRVNLIGEHIDYNGGEVMPAALSLGIDALVRPHAEPTVCMRSLTESGEVRLDLRGPLVACAEDGWGNYPKGVISALRERGHAIGGADLLFRSDLPTGAGLSSSAALEVVTAWAFLTLCGVTSIDRVDVARLCQRVENEFVGVRCGIMDQFAVANGRRDCAMRLDCATLACTHVPVLIADHRLVLLDTTKRRGLAESRYNERREECEAVFNLLSAQSPVDALARAPLALVEAAVTDPVLRRRARHVVTEQRRVVAAGEALAQGDAAGFGALLVASHASLRDDYEVTGPELDAIVEAALGAPGCAGARMTGAGFGGCAIALVREGSHGAFERVIRERYLAAVGREAAIYAVTIGDGVGEIVA